MTVLSSDDTKLVSKTGMTGVIQTLIGSLVAMAPSLLTSIFPNVDPAAMAQIVGGIMAAFGLLVVWFRKRSDGKTPKIV